MEIVLIIVILLELTLGLFVLTQEAKNISNRLFSLLTFLASLWTLSNYLTDQQVSIQWLHASYSLGALMICIGLIWTSVITSENIFQKKFYLIFLIGIFFSLYSLKVGFITQTYEVLQPETLFIGKPGGGLIIYSVYYLIFAFLIIWKLITAIKRSSNKIEKIQLKYVLVGATVTLLITAFNSILFPINSFFLIAGIDNVGFLIFLLLITFSISKHQLFNIKIIFVQLIISTLWLLMILRIVFSQNFQELFRELGLFLIGLLLGSLLIRSTLQGIKQRIEIEKLSQKLRGVYAVLDNKPLP